MTDDVTRLVPARWRDVWRIRRWRNERSAREASGNTASIGRWEHLRWYQRTLRRRGSRIFVVMYGPLPVGTARWRHMANGYVDCSIALDPDWRGRGIGSAAIAALVELAKLAGHRMVVAEVRAWNTASIVAFKKAGFTQEFEYGEMVTLVRSCV